MEKLIRHVGTAVPLQRTGVDTDQIIPAKYIVTVSRTGFSEHVFASWRRDPDFALNQPQFAGATILITGADFGIGSSREHAVWALQDYGFKVVLSPRFGDIFYTNAASSGLLAVRLSELEIQFLADTVLQMPATEIVVDVEQRLVTCGSQTFTFEMSESIRHRFLEGIDDIDVTLTHEDIIAAYESVRHTDLPAVQIGDR